MSNHYVTYQIHDGRWNILEAPNDKHTQYVPVDGPFDTEQQADKIATLWNNGERVEGVYYGD